MRSLRSPNRRRSAGGTSVVVAALAAVTVGVSPGGAARADLIGANLDGISYFDTAHVWADAIRNFSPLGTPDKVFEPNPDVTYDANHNALQDWGAIAFLTNYPGGTYKFSYSYANGTLGTANVTLGFDQFVSMTNVQTVGATVTADVLLRHPNNDPSAGSLSLAVRNNDPSNPVSNVRLVAPGYSTINTPVYTDSFIRRTQLFSSLRFMDWGGTNDSTVSSWSQRVVGNQSNLQGAKGVVSYENQISLANATGHSAWINVPYLADDDYVHQMARLYRDTMNPNATIQVELSNEVWNASFKQFFQNLEAAKANPLLDNVDDFTKSAQQYALRAKQVGDIFRQEFGAQAGRVQIVFGGQNTLPYWAQQGLDFLNRKFGDTSKTPAQNVSQWFQALAIAPYFGDQSSEVQQHAGSVDDMINYLMGQVSANGYLDNSIKEAKTQALSYALQLYAYEGGDSLSKHSNNLSEAFVRQLQADPRFYQVMSQLYDTWKADGGSMFMAFSHIGGDRGGGLWGLLNNDALTGSQKWDATISRLVPAGDANLDGTVDYKDLLIVAQNFGLGSGFWESGDFNHDGVVNADDLLVIAGNYGAGTPFAGADVPVGAFASDWALAQATVPEPSTAGLLALAAGACLARRRRRASQNESRKRVVR